MNPRDPNVALVEIVARALGDLNSEVVFIGGCAVGLLITDDARPPVRATMDVDLVTSVATLSAHHEFSARLRALDFVEDPELICRWRLGKVKVDVMPMTENVLGFANRWSEQVIRDAQATTLPSGQGIRLISAPCLIATKLEAFFGRGEGDFAASHDLEDLVALIDGRPAVVEEVAAANGELREYLREELDGLLGATAFAVEFHLGPSEAEQARAEIIIERMRAIAGI